MHDIVFISYDEINADMHYDALLELYPQAKRVHGIKGILNAHREAALLSSTPMFWVIDGDSFVYESSKSTINKTEYDMQSVHVWRAQNPVNGLKYGYGGIKLLPKALVLSMPSTYTDMTGSLSKNFVVHHETLSETRFNSSPLHAWRGAYRECSKLLQSIDIDSKHRIDIWRNIGETAAFGKYAMWGAKDATNTENAINDFDYLLEKFKRDVENE